MMLMSLMVPTEKSNAATERSGESFLCYHCGTPCVDQQWDHQEHSFCCQGCRIVYDLLNENGLSNFYRIQPQSGVKVEGNPDSDRFAYLDDAAVLDALLDYHQGRRAKVTFSIPSIHCVACVWLLENLYQLGTGMGESKVNFPRKEVRINFDPTVIKLSELVQLLTRLGYEPELTWSDVSGKTSKSRFKRIHLQVGIAGFAFGNIMLFSFPSYAGMSQLDGQGFHAFFAWLGVLVSVPVLLYSALDYWKAAWNCWSRRMLTIELPIAIGLVALFGQSLHEISTGTGEGYLDSFCGLVFFLLCGKLFQQKTYDRMSFDRDFRSFFPLSVVRLEEGKERTVPVSSIQIGDWVLLRHGDLVPADARLMAGEAVMDYSFVTGESDPVECREGDKIFAGGRQKGGRMQVEIIKPVSQSYLTSLWNQDVFNKSGRGMLQSITDRISRYFTVAVVGVATASAAYWTVVDSGKALYAFTSVLIVACPCALALAAPFAHGAALRLLGARGIFARNGETLEAIPTADTVVFDKTGTLTQSNQSTTNFEGEPLSDVEAACLDSLARHSTHPHCLSIAAYLADFNVYPEPVRSFLETTGKGIEGTVCGEEIWMGAAAWLESRQVKLPEQVERQGSVVHVAVQGVYRGSFRISAPYRPEIDCMLERVGKRRKLALLTGDRDREAVRLAELLGGDTPLLFEQSPHDKLNYVKSLQEAGQRVLMVGDGLNDSGALKQSQVGIAVSEDVGRFTPASDVIIRADRVKDLDRLVRFCGGMTRVIYAAFTISILYNLLGVTFAARGLLSPLICAVLMPLSSMTVVTFACFATKWQGNKAGLTK